MLLHQNEKLPILTIGELIDIHRFLDLQLLKIPEERLPMNDLLELSEALQELQSFAQQCSSAATALAYELDGAAKLEIENFSNDSAQQPLHFRD